MEISQTDSRPAIAMGQFSVMNSVFWNFYLIAAFKSTHHGDFREWGVPMSKFT